jgi:adenylate cyclase
VGTEIERKFLVSEEAFSKIEATHHVALRQGYLSSETGRTVRVRLQNEQGYLTIKGKAQGFARPEFEYPIPQADAEALLELCPRPLIEKWRHYVEYAGKIWEVDEFFGDNAGLIVAELELESEEETFEHPAWLGAEVTFDPRYHNSRLAQYPFTAWKDTAQGAEAAAESGPTGPGAFYLLVELYVRPGDEEPFRAYEARALGLLGAHGLELVARLAHGERALGAEAPFETHLLRVPSEAALTAFEKDEARVALAEEQKRVLLDVKLRRGQSAPLGGVSISG